MHIDLDFVNGNAKYKDLKTLCTVCVSVKGTKHYQIGSTIFLYISFNTSVISVRL